jgi:hypothetical protein
MSSRSLHFLILACPNMGQRGNTFGSWVAGARNAACVSRYGAVVMPLPEISGVRHQAGVETAGQRPIA